MSRGAGLTADDVLYGELPVQRKPVVQKKNSAKISITRREIDTIAGELWNDCDHAYHTGKNFRFPVYSEQGELVEYAECDPTDLIVEVQNMILDIQDENKTKAQVAALLHDRVNTMEQRAANGGTLTKEIAVQALPILRSFSNLADCLAS